jgi:hypothetical protein
MDYKPGTEDLIKQMEGAAGITHRLFGNKDLLWAIAALGATRDVAAIPHLVPFLLARASEANAAATAIDALLSYATDDQLVLLDSEVRSRNGWQLTSWFNLKPRDLPAAGIAQRAGHSRDGVVPFERLCSREGRDESCAYQ